MKYKHCKDGCPLRADSCTVKLCTDWTFGEDGEIIPGEPTGGFFCTKEDCPMIYSHIEVSASDLWYAYKTKKIRFGVDAVGNATTTNIKTGKVVRSEDFTKEELKDACTPKDERLPSGLLRDRDWASRKKYF